MNKKIQSFKVQIGGWNKEDGVVTYNMRILASDENSFHITDRYRNMRNLWENIRRDADNPDRIPDFPPKKWFGNKTREFLEQRKCALQVFFNTLLENPDRVVYTHIMSYFKKLANNREAKDALQNIEDGVSPAPRKKMSPEEPTGGATERLADKPAEGGKEEEPEPAGATTAPKPDFNWEEYSKT